MHPPYPPSWVDRLILRIERLPIPAWLTYLLGALVVALIITVSLWIDGSVPTGKYGEIPGVLPPVVVFPLALYHYLTGVGGRSLHRFRPLLSLDEAELAQIEYQLTNLPAWIGWLLIPIALLASIPYLLGNPRTWGELSPQSPAPLITAFIVVTYFSATYGVLLIRSFRQLRIVSRLHTQATEIYLLKLKPAHAFSTLTASTAIGILVMLAIGLFRNPSDLATGSWDIVNYLGNVLLALLIFALPLIGMRGRLQREKDAALDATNELLRRTTDRLKRKVEADDYADLKGMETAVNTLIRERELLGKVSTWPWDAGTFRGFASTLLLPIFLWLVTRLLGKFV